jgi:DNA-directed RNA polymerase specialized sigma24 family protein
MDDVQVSGRSGDGAHRPLEEFKAALTALSQADMVRLRRAADHLVGDGVMGRDDLIQEAYCRVLAGSRPWPSDVRLLPFLINVMKSVVSNERRKRRRSEEDGSAVRAPLSLHDAAGGLAIDAEDPAPNIEEALLANAGAAEFKREILDLFVDDLAAQMLVEGVMDGMQGEELRQVTDLDQTAFNSKRRLMRRRIEKHMPGRTRA